jgi:integrase/recombinase XerD
MNARFSQFIQEKQYLSSVSPRTVEWYAQSLRWLASPAPSADELKQVVVRMRTGGLKETSCNSRIRAINSYLHWSSGIEGKCGPACPHPKIPRLKEPKLVLPIFADPQITQLYRWKPKGFYQRRLHLLILLLLDTGARITEALTLQVNDIDFDNMLLKLDGKGRKERLVPFSPELRRLLFRYVKDFGPVSTLLSTKDGRRLDRHVMARDVRILCRRLEIQPPKRLLHACRHTFATKFIRQTKDVVTLQRILGHSSVTQTMRYLHLDTDDLRRARSTFSILV